MLLPCFFILCFWNCKLVFGIRYWILQRTWHSYCRSNFTFSIKSNEWMVAAAYPLGQIESSQMKFEIQLQFRINCGLRPDRTFFLFCQSVCLLMASWSSNFLDRKHCLIKVGHDKFIDMLVDSTLSSSYSFGPEEYLHIYAAFSRLWLFKSIHHIHF